MKYHVSKLHCIAQSIIPVGWIAMLTWLIFLQGKDLQSILLVITIMAIFSVIHIYSLVKQVKTPVFVTDENGILIQSVLRKKEKLDWALVMNLKKYPFLGYKLETLGKDIWLPTGMLSGDDTKSLIEEIRAQIKI